MGVAEMKKGTWYDYDLQVWVIDGVIQTCGHKDRDTDEHKAWCAQARLAGMRIDDIDNVGVRS